MMQWRANTKLTLSLRVLGRRPDGYHELDALAAIVDEPHDELSIIPGAHEAELLVEPAGSAPHGEANLVWRTRAALCSTAGLRLRKGIPTEAGLGGGSADAAAALRLLRTTQTDAELHDIAASLGADVPACLEGGLVRMRGIGDIVEPIALPASPLHLVLATPTFGCSTADVYRAWDELGAPTGRRLLAPAFGTEPWRNDLEPAARHVEPRLKSFAGAFSSVADTLAFMCGSGSTHFVMVETRDDAVRIADAVRDELDTRCVAVATVGTIAS
jgi:4-diphosphocytidyl-2-C-methyl-D-erythritol kinase